MKYFSVPLLRAPALLLSAASAICLPLGARTAIAQAPQTAAQPPIAAAQPLLLDRAHVLETHGQIDLAVQTWKQILLVAPNDPQALRGLARAARLNGDEALASTYLARLPAGASRAKSPAPGESSSLLGDHRQELKQADAFEDSPKTDGQKPGPARPGQQSGAQTARSSARSRLNPTRGDARGGLVVTEDGGAGASPDERANDQDPRWTDPKSLHAAEIRYRGAVASRPSNVEALRGLGDTLLKEGQAAAAIPYFTRLVKLQASSTPAWRGLFLAELRAGETVPALHTEQRIPLPNRAELARDPAFLCGLATAYTATGREAEARQVLQSALKLPFGADPMGTETTARLQYAGLLQSSNHLDQAADLYRQILAKDHEDTSAWRGLVRAEHGMNQDKEAMQTIESMSPARYADAIQEPAFAAIAASLYRSQRRLQLEATASAGPTLSPPLAVRPVRGLGTAITAPRVSAPASVSREVAVPAREVSEKLASTAASSEPKSDETDRVRVPETDPHGTSVTTKISPRERPAAAHVRKPVQAMVKDVPNVVTASVPTPSSPPATLPNQPATAPVVPEAEEVFGPYVPFKPIVVVPAEAGGAPALQKATPPPEEMESVPIANLLPAAAVVLNTAWLPDLSPSHPIVPRQVSSLLPASGESKPPLEDYSTPAMEGAQSASQR